MQKVFKGKEQRRQKNEVYVKGKGYMQKVLQGTEQRMQKKGVFAKGNILRLDEPKLYELNGFSGVMSYLFGTLGASLLNRQNRICQESFLFLFSYVVAIFSSFYVKEIF